MTGASDADQRRYGASVDDQAVTDISQRPDRFFNRELSWLDFGARVLALAADPDVPLLERVKFLAIFSGNLDEFDAGENRSFIRKRLVSLIAEFRLERTVLAACA